MAHAQCSASFETMPSTAVDRVGSTSASQVPLDVLAAVFCRPDVGVRERGAARLVCRNWRSAIDSLTVRRLTLRSPGPHHCALHLLRRFPLLQSLALGSQVTTNRAAFSFAVGQLPTLVHLTHLSLEFGSAAAVRLPAALQALIRLQALSLSVGVVQNSQVQGHAAVSVGDRDGDVTDGDGGAVTGTGAAAAGPSLGSFAGGPRRAATTTHAITAATAVAATAAAPAAQHVPPAGLLPLLSRLSSLAYLELANIAVSVPDVLSAVRRASNAAAICGGGLRRVVLIGSGVNLTGVGDPEALAQLAVLETLCVDGCTGADTLVPLLRHLRGVRHLTLAGMDYAWAAAAGYHHRRAFDSGNNLEQYGANNNGPNQLVNVGNPYNNAQQQNAYDGLGGDGGGGGGNGGEGYDDGAAAAAAASGRPLAFLRCLPQLASLSLGGSFLRTLPNRDISGLTALTALDLSGNGIDDLPQGLASLPLLSRLELSHNELVSLPAWLGQMQSLESLSCHHNCLERFPTLLYDLIRLSYLAMGHNRVSWWPVECVLPRHRRISAAAAAVAAAGGTNLAGTATAAAAAVTAGLSPGSSPSTSAFSSSPSYSAASAAAANVTNAQPLSLVCLDLSHNRLFGLPGGLPLLCQLRSLRLRESLAGLDGAGTTRAMGLLAGLTALQELDLSSNHLDQHAIVPLSELRGLRQLWLADNGLEELPLGLAHLSRLTLLSLRANRFIEVPVCLRWLSALEALDLSCNRLSELPPWIGGGGCVNGHTNEPANGHVQRSPPSHPNANDVDHHPNARRRTSAGSGKTSDHQPPKAMFQNFPPSTQSPSPRLEEEQQQQKQEQQQRVLPDHPGLIGLRHLDVSQQYSVVVRENAAPYIPPRLEVQPPHCLYGPLQGDLPQELLLLPALRSLVLQRHPLLRVGASRVLPRLQARGVEVIHPKPLRVDALPGAAAAAFTTAATSGGLLFQGRHSALLRAATGGGGGGGGGGDAHLAVAAASFGGGGGGPSAARVGSPGESAVLVLVLLVSLPLATAAICLGLGLPPHQCLVVIMVVVVVLTRVMLYGACLGRDLQRRRRR